MGTAILTSYFTAKKHPNDPSDSHVKGRNSSGFVNGDDYTYIKPWYDSVSKLKDVSGFIFHDGLSNSFVEELTTENIKFIPVDSNHSYSNNDWRFFCYRNFLNSRKFDSVFMADGSDVTVVKNPSGIFDECDADIFACKDSIKLEEFPYLDVHLKAGWDSYVKFLVNNSRYWLINMGVIGAKYDIAKEFLNKFCETRIRMGSPDFNADMWVGQYVIRELMKDKKLHLGDPFTSVFKGYENDRDDVFFIHK